MTGWRKVSEREVLNHKRMRLVEDRVVLPNGLETDYLREVNKKDYVTVVATHGDKIVMVHDYSYPHDRLLLQFPDGEIDTDETPEAGATRELQEETGFKADKLTILGRNLDNPRRNTSTNIVLLAKDVEETGERNLDAEESLNKVVLLTEAEIRAKIASGEIIQKNTLAAWALYSSRRTKP